ncbi:helicase-related protein [Mycolicibacterium setense]|uniref:helicase-related protein n=1 Tax=Mycolicibacterium setense TaxID=431269 RepID=UPI0005750953|nr:helicase-related protein [Mycolicibacterium setense]KHO22978.1 helicase [Mycolicibacterium setense]MCV7115538.1 helicase [Mycolicibacterium setense]
MITESDPLSLKYDFRDGMIRELGRDLIGPSNDGDDAYEVIKELPLDRYVVGVLWPSNDDVQEAPDPDSDDSGDSEGFEDTPVSQALMRYPSSMGITFTIDLSRTTEVKVDLHVAQYIPSDADAEPEESGRSAKRRQKSRPAEWLRVPTVIDPVALDVGRSRTEYLSVAPDLQLYVYVRQPKDGAVTVSLALRNTKVANRKGELRDAFAWFQVGIAVSTDKPAIMDRTQPQLSSTDPDLSSAALLYRNARVFAIGHGCAATWEPTTDPYVSAVESTFLPQVEVHRARPAQLSDIDIRMSTLADGADAVVLENLRAMVAAYREWIDGLDQSVVDGDTDVPPRLRGVAAGHMEDARSAAMRIEAGIELLSGDPQVFKAFRLANRAMQIQRARQDWVRKGHQGAVDPGTDQSWYPFQIAYILLNLRGLADRKHQDRDIADLLWFPTGGGKTEAYLGLIAFTIILRRLRNSAATGVAVIMRYTLRLLTIQQFERATTLMCALERLRLDRQDLGTKSFSIGLWVGSKATPNNLDDARRALNNLRAGQELAENNPVQLTQCPWCGEDLDYSNYVVEKLPERHLVIACRTPSCDFRDGLPVHVVDEDIYRERPELVLGTVDKFAMMAWNERVRDLFSRDGLGEAPDLIIQDELHLISGPLGSIVGLYEIAVDAACGVRLSDAGPATTRPKVIASTATIRRADRQIKAVFDRDARQFPPPGIDPDVSFFAEPAPRDALGTRAYVGVMTAGASHATLLVRTYGALLQAAQDLKGDEDSRDPYWTLMGYFNSLRVLGSATLQVDADVRDRLKVVAGRNETTPRKISRVTELTSRVPSSEIPEALKGLETALPDDEVDDVVLATNMISVGLDIDRLGLMAVMGQPQSSAEYIQATSRVGRKHPGLVVTIFNSARSRDRSHYESFLPFHQALYRAVEATSATPFAARARDRGLQGILVALARLLVDELAPDTAAHLADANYDSLTELVKIIDRRVRSTAPEEADATLDQIDALIDVWSSEAAAKPNMRYNNPRNVEAALLVEAGAALVEEYSQEAAPWPTLRSMRDVDAESSLYPIAFLRKSK